MNSKKPKINIQTLKYLSVVVPFALQVNEVIIHANKETRKFKTNRGIDNYTKKLLQQTFKEGNLKIELRGLDLK